MGYDKHANVGSSMSVKWLEGYKLKYAIKVELCYNDPLELVLKYSEGHTIGKRKPELE